MIIRLTTHSVTKYEANVLIARQLPELNTQQTAQNALTCVVPDVVICIDATDF